MAGSRTSDEEQAPRGLLLLLAALFLSCGASAPAVYLQFGPAWSLFAAAASLLLWLFVGPPALPGFVPGLMGMRVLLINTLSVLAAGVALLIYQLGS